MASTTRTSVGALARMMLIDDERLTFVEGTVRRSIGQALVEVGVAGDSTGGKAARAQLLAKFGSVNVSAEALAANDFHLRGNRASSLRDYRAGARCADPDRPDRASRHTPMCASTDRLDGTKQLEAAARLSANINRFNLATDLRYRKQYLRSGPAPPGELNLALIGTGRVGNVRLRGSSSFDVAPAARFRTAELSAYWSASDTRRLGRRRRLRRGRRIARARASPISAASISMAIAVTGEAATDGSLALGFNLNFSLDPGGGFELSRQPLAAAGAVNARVYRDLNDNGVRDPDRAVREGRAGHDRATPVGARPPTPRARSWSAASPPSRPVTVGDRRKQPVGSDAGPAQGAAGGGAAAGRRRPRSRSAWSAAAISKARSSRAAASASKASTSSWSTRPGKVVATTRTDFDGFFLFERVPYGDYRIRLSSDSAQAAGLARELNVRGLGQRREIDRPAGLDPRRTRVQNRFPRVSRPKI